MSSLLIKYFLIMKLLILLIKQGTLKHYGRKCDLEILVQLIVLALSNYISLTRVKSCMLQSFSKHKLCEIYRAASFNLLQPVSHLQHCSSQQQGLVLERM